VIKPYQVYNGNLISNLHMRMVSMMEDKLEDFMENLEYEDEDSQGTVALELILKVMRLSGVPKPVDEELEFLEYCAMKESHSL
jgi:hypothetical protein